MGSAHASLPIAFLTIVALQISDNDGAMFQIRLK